MIRRSFLLSVMGLLVWFVAGCSHENHPLFEEPECITSQEQELHAIGANGSPSHSHTITFDGKNWDHLTAHRWAPGKYSTTTILPREWSVDYDATKTYQWECPITTLTTNEIPHLSWGDGYPWFISSYNSGDLNAFGDYMHDLYVYKENAGDNTKNGGFEGSNNFLITYGYREEGNPYMPDDGRPILKFADGRARTIKSVYVNSTVYFLNVLTNGNALSPALKEGEEVILHAYGYNANDEQTGHVTMVFASYNNSITTWTEWDLSGLGAIVKLRLNMTGGTNNGYGFSLPAYYALDNITVEW